jgi:aspartyl-tRNA(Asn)/glutamyl-tRNA(Gln) amidotransferase subunit A
MLDSTVAQLSAALAARKVSSVELTQGYLDRIARINPALNAFITLDPETSLAYARAADARIGAGGGGPLTGVPVGHKDLFLTEGWRTTCGSRMLANFVAPYESHVTAQMKAAGMVTMGKMNMDEYAMGSSNETSYFGTVKNPWNTALVPGGSSGGSAAAVASRMLPATTGTDTGGSIRQPAMFCGITGLKPTYGLCSRYGMIAFASSLDQAGPLAKTAEDCALLLNAMVGHDPRDATSLDRPQEDYTRHLRRAPADPARPLAGIRIGLPREYFGDGTAPDVLAAVEAALTEYRKLGAQMVEISLPNVELSVPVYYVIAPAEASSNLSRFDGVRYGHRAAHYDDLLDMYKKTRAEGFGAEVKRRILIGTYVLSAGYYDAYYLKAQQVRRLIADDHVRAFRDIDIIMGPTAPSTAFPFGDKADDPVQMYLNDIFTIAANLAGLPAMSVPCGFDGRGLPVGLHLVSNYFDEARMLDIAHRYQQATDWHTRRPAGVTA